jgi:hypothetical protein
MRKQPVKKAPHAPSNGSQTYGRIDDISIRTGMTHWAVEEAIRNGDLPAMKPGKHYVVAMADADAWMAKLRQRDERPLFNNFPELNAWLKRHGYPTIDPKAPPIPPPTAEETKNFFESLHSDEYGYYTTDDPDADADD